MTTLVRCGKTFTIDQKLYDSMATVSVAMEIRTTVTLTAVTMRVIEEEDEEDEQEEEEGFVEKERSEDEEWDELKELTHSDVARFLADRRKVMRSWVLRMVTVVMGTRYMTMKNIDTR